MVDRRTIRPSETLYERMNALRIERGLSWDEFFEVFVFDEGDADSFTTRLDRIDERLQELPKATADEVEGRLR